MSNEVENMKSRFLHHPLNLNSEHRNWYFWVPGTKWHVEKPAHLIITGKKYKWDTLINININYF